NALHWAQGKPVDGGDAVRKDIVLRLLRRGYDPLINVGCDAKKTPLSLAAEYNNTPLIQFLVQHGANVESRDTSERTPLRVAIDHGQLESVRLLLKLGADPRAKDVLAVSPSRAAHKSPQSARKIQDAIKAAKKEQKRFAPLE
ncbi:hypothetical protein LTS18_001335, partial [Coniosporium uncinatum]